LQYHQTLQELVKIAQFYFNVMALYANMERFFPWCSHKSKRKRNFSCWTGSSLKLVCNLKHLSCKQFH